MLQLVSLDVNLLALHFCFTLELFFFCFRVRRSDSFSEAFGRGWLPLPPPWGHANHAWSWNQARCVLHPVTRTGVSH